MFKITLEDLGNNVFLSPRVPINTCKGEDTVIERIPVCLTLPSCIRALELTSMITKDNPELKVYVYVSEVPMEYLEDPNKHEIKVPDRWITGELWVTHPWTFIKLSSATIRKHMEIPYSAYSRYAFTMENFDEVIDRRCITNIYGEMTSFSFIELDQDRVEFALKYYGEHPYADSV